jgi:hypothetical protein
MNTVIEIKGVSRSLFMTKDLVFGICVRNDESDFVPLSSLEESSKREIIRIFLDNQIARSIWKEELEGA